MYLLKTRTLSYATLSKSGNPHWHTQFSNLQTSFNSLDRVPFPLSCRLPHRAHVALSCPSYWRPSVWNSPWFCLPLVSLICLQEHGLFIPWLALHQQEYHQRDAGLCSAHHLRRFAALPFPTCGGVTLIPGQAVCHPSPCIWLIFCGQIVPCFANILFLTKSPPTRDIHMYQLLILLLPNGHDVFPLFPLPLLVGILL